MGSSRGNGEGSIYKRADGRWCGQITIGTDPKTGKRNRKYFYGDTRKEVAKKITETRHKLYTGSYIEPSQIKLGEWLNKWIEGRKSSIADNTYKGYKNIIDNHISPEIGDIQLKDLTAREVQDLLNHKLEKGKVKGKGGLSHRTVKYIYTTIRAALQQALKEKLIAANICNAVEPPNKQNEKEMQTWTKAQVNTFLKEAKNYNYYIIYYLALNTGMRQSELLGLKWNDINFNSKTAEVKRQLSRDKDYRKLKSTAGKRTIPLADDIIKTLKSYQIRQSENKLALGKAYNDNGLVGSCKDGEPIGHRALVREFKRIIKAADLPEIRFHDLRHTFATVFIEIGGNIKTLQQILGHSSITITIDTYSHVSEDMLKTAADKIQMMYKDQVQDGIKSIKSIKSDSK